MNIIKAKKIAKQFGIEICIEAYNLSEVGEGGFTIAVYLNILDKNGNVNIRRADNIIDAGRAIVEDAAGDLNASIQMLRDNNADCERLINIRDYDYANSAMVIKDAALNIMLREEEKKPAASAA